MQPAPWLSERPMSYSLSAPSLLVKLIQFFSALLLISGTIRRSRWRESLRVVTRYRCSRFRWHCQHFRAGCRTHRDHCRCIKGCLVEAQAVRAKASKSGTIMLCCISNAPFQFLLRPAQLLLNIDKFTRELIGFLVIFLLFR